MRISNFQMIVLVQALLLSSTSCITIYGPRSVIGTIVSVKNITNIANKTNNLPPKDPNGSVSADGLLNVKTDILGNLYATFFGNVNLTGATTAPSVNNQQVGTMKCYININGVNFGGLFAGKVPAVVNFGRPAGATFRLPQAIRRALGVIDQTNTLFGVFSWTGKVYNFGTAKYIIDFSPISNVVNDYVNQCTTTTPVSWTLSFNWTATPPNPNPNPNATTNNVTNNPNWKPIYWNYTLPHIDYFPSTFFNSTNYDIPSYWRVPKNWTFPRDWNFATNRTAAQILSEPAIPHSGNYKDIDRECPMVFSVYPACQINIKFQNIYCNATCNLNNNCVQATACIDYFPYCQQNMIQGDCTNYTFVPYVCQKTCGTCQLNPSSTC